MTLRASIQAGLLNQSTSQFIDGSLRFNQTSKNYLTRTPSSAGNRKVWTLSFWTKLTEDTGHLFSANNDAFQFEYRSGGQLLFANTGPTSGNTLSTARFRDYNQFYHVVIHHDATRLQARIFINGEENFTATLSDADGSWNNTTSHNINGRSTSLDSFASFGMSNVYSIDGLALGPGYFGFTDPLTGTWRPKKFKAEGTTVNDGTQWSSFLSSTGALSFQANGFNGSVSTGAYSSDSSPITFTPPSTIHFQTLRVFTGTGSGTNVANINGGSNIVLNNNAWTTISETGGSFSTLTVDNTTGNGTRINAIEVDGVVMVDSTTTNLDFGTNGFYLPMDGSSSIGKDQSGKGNDFSPKGFGGSVSLDNSIVSGALPILNTTQGGTQAGVGTRADSNSSHLVLAVPLVGNANDVHHTIKGSGSAKTVTAVGNAAASTVQSNFYGGSFVYDGTGDALKSTSSGLAPGTSDFCCEGWFYYTDLSYAFGILGNVNSAANTTDWQLIHQANGTLTIWSGSAHTSIGDAPFETGKWVHIAYVRDGATHKVYVNGVQMSTTVTRTGDDLTYNGLDIGARDDGALSMTGYVQDVRFYIGTTKYTSDFVVPSTIPDVLPDTPSGVIGSPITNITDGTVSFDGNGDSLVCTDSSSWDFGTGDFTVECFAYFNDTSSTNRTMINRWTNIWTFQIVSSTQNLRFYTSSANVATANNTIGPNKWYHFAASRSSGTLKLFIDGVESASGSLTNDLSGSTPLNIGAENSTLSQPVNGFISNVRIVNGTALYTSSFTPPTAPLTNVTNTKLLCCQSPTSETTATILPDSLLNAPLSATAFTDSSPTGASIANEGSIVTASAGTNTFNISNAASLNGSSQRLTTNNANISFINSWTVDVYFKLDSSASDGNFIINSGYGSQTTHYLYIGLDDDEKPFVETSSSGSRTTASDAISKNVWYHVRAIQNLSNIRLFVNGTNVVTHARNTVDLKSTGTFTIGSGLDNGNNSNNFHGLIGPVRAFASDIGDPTSGGNATTGGALSNVSGAPGSITTKNGNATATTFNPFNTDIDTVLAKPSTICTWDPLFTDGRGNNAPATLSNGFLTAASPNSGDWNIAVGSVYVSRGKYYWELTIGQGNDSHMCGVLAVPTTDGGAFSSTSAFYYNPLSWTYYIDTGKKRNGSASGTNYGSNTTATTGDVVGFAIDLDAGTISVYKNGLNLGVMYDNLPSDTNFTPLWMASKQATNNTVVANFGQHPFKYSPPEGHGPVVAHPPETILARPDQFVGVTTYTGNSSTNRPMKIGFQPDLVWLKSRESTFSHYLGDSVRGKTKLLQSNSNAAEITSTTGITAFNSDGFTLGNGSETNLNNDDMVAWCWKAGGNKNTFNVDDVGYASASAAGITDGTISLTGASVGTKQGFSILKYTGSGSNGTIAHGLSQAPDFFFGRDLEDSGGSRDWIIYHQSVGATGRLKFTTGNTSTSSTFFQDTLPTNSLISIGTSNDINSTNDYIMYCWHDVPGLQKFGSYLSIGGNDGNFVYLGFKPAVLWIKSAVHQADTTSWCIFTDEIDKSNPFHNPLYANKNAEEGKRGNNVNTGTFDIDLVSNGFKLLTNVGEVNEGSSGTDRYVYCAWAKQPAFGPYGSQSNAR